MLASTHPPILLQTNFTTLQIKRYTISTHMQNDVGVSGVELPVAGLGPRHDLHFLGEEEIATFDHLHAYAATHSAAAS